MLPLFVVHLVKQAHKADAVVDEAQGIVEPGVVVEKTNGNHRNVRFPDQADGGILPLPFADGPALAGLQIRHGARRKDSQRLTFVNLLQRAFDAADAGGGGHLPGGGGIHGNEIGPKSLEPHQELVHQHLGLGADVPQDIHQADPVNMAVNVVGNGNESPFGKLFQALGVADGKIYPCIVQNAFGIVRSGGRASRSHTVVGFIGFVNARHLHNQVVKNLPELSLEDRGEFIPGFFWCDGVHYFLTGGSILL